MTLILAAALSIQIDLGGLITGRKPAQDSPRATCNIRTVSYRFVGTAGTTFRYDGETFTIPATGSIELIASRNHKDYEFEGNRLPLDVWPIDQFGSRTVALPALR